MSHLNELIEVLCPHGVDYIPMWQITTWDKKFNAVDRAKQPEVRKYEYLLASEIKDLNVNGGDVKLLTTNESDLWTTQLVADRTIYDAEIIAIPWGGNAIVQHYNGKFITSDNRIAIARNPKVLDMKFLYYFISNHLDVLATFYRGSGIKHPNMAKVLDWPIPVPPIEVQQEIVRILDNFTALEAELEAELEARKKQYDYYRQELLSFDDAIPLRTVGELCEVTRGRVMSKDYLAANAGQYPVYSSQTANSGIFGWIDTYDFEEESITWTTDGANAGSVFYHIEEKFSITNVCGLLRMKPGVDVSTKYLYHCLSIMTKKHVSAGMGNPKLMSTAMKKVKVPIPSLAEQERVAEVLDRFDALVNDLSSGLPAEITARRKQYEYYRDQLLTFKELAS